MPGLLGVISDDVRDEPLLDRMIDSIRHEPWYKVDRYVNRPFNVARVHLGIFSPGPQPVFNEDKTLCLLMDGKVYGYDDEKRRLEGKHRFASDGDPEYCLHLYEEFGMQSFERLNGNFVLLICDLKAGKTVIVNDRNCLRNVYFAAHRGVLVFAPEAKAILLDGVLEREVDVEALAMSLAHGEFWDDRTLFEAIHFLPPASVLSYTQGQLSLARYWDLHYQPDYALSDGSMVEQLVEATRRAVAIRMMEPVRYGISLSGGLDSRVVLAAVDAEKRKSVATYTYGPLDCDEVKIGERVARRCGVPHRSVEITPGMILENAEQESWLADGRNSVLVSYFYPIYRQLRSDVDVVFDGYELDATLGGSYMAKHRLHGQSKDELLQDFRRDRRLVGDDELLRLFLPKYHGAVREAPLKAFDAVYGRLRTDNPKAAFDEFFWRTHLAFWSTWHVYIRDELEISYPTVDKDLIALIYRIPPEKRANHLIYRQFLKRLAPELAGIPYNRTMLPPSWPLFFWKAGRAYLFGREKIKRGLYTASGGRIYIRNRRRYIEEVGWMRENEGWRKYFRDLLLDKGTALRAYLDQDYVKHLIEEHESGAGDNAGKILRLATTELFLRKFVG